MTLDTSDFTFDPKIAYFSMEIGLENDLPTYSGGLGVLAGDTLKSCADLNLPVVAISLLYNKGYFRQEIDSEGKQKEHPVEWDPHSKLKLLPHKILVKEIQGREVYVRGWLYKYKGVQGHEIPVIFLDTNLEENQEEDRHLTDSLYGGEEEYRLKQEIIIGIGGVRFLRALGFKNLHTFHLNEGHSSLLTLELLRENQRTVYETWDEDTIWDFELVKNHCVFTTHTPVAAGHDVFSYELVEKVLKIDIPLKTIKQCAGDKNLNMTTLGLNLSRFANGVALMHGNVSRSMFPNHQIDYITNGIHTITWAQDSFKELFNKYIKYWEQDPKYLRQAEMIPCDEVWQAHMESKQALMKEVSASTPVNMDPEIFTIGFARRSATYKRSTLMFNDLDRLIKIAENCPGIQLVYSGKAHPRDTDGKMNIQRIHEFQKKIEQKTDKLKLVYMPNYNMDLGFLITGGVDLWVNTPIRPHEASGTSGMKAALNGVLNLSILDGWWVEGCIEGVTGWAIGDLDPHHEMDLEQLAAHDSDHLYTALEKKVLPLYYDNRKEWIEMQRHSISINASFFNTQRQMEQYICKAYFLG